MPGRLRVLARRRQDAEHDSQPNSGTVGDADAPRRVPQAPRLRLVGAVTTIMVMSQTMSLAYIKSHLSEVVDQVEHEHERVTLTRNGVPAAVLVSPDDLTALEDMLDLLSDPAAMNEIAAAREEIAKGRTVDAAHLRSKYLNR